MLQRLAAPTGEMKQIMSELGLVTADGNQRLLRRPGQYAQHVGHSRALNDIGWAA
ncbi:MAG: hypothetical protein IPK53_03830 [bacterium]|nr:hypothetical protein [bacterium]